MTKSGKAGTVPRAVQSPFSPKSEVQSPESIVQGLESRELLERLGAIALRLGTRSFLVGGPVRDMILGRASPDLDIAVEDKSHEFGAAVAKEFGGRFVFHTRFLSGSVQLLPPPSSLLPPHLDITQTRAETYERPAVLPAVRPASIVGDLGRRDFTINSMALELTPGSFGTFIDPFDGRADVTQRRVRVLHARSFIDDPTRIFRCIRFATRLGFGIERQTLELMRAAVEQRLPAFLTPERILYELRLICAEPLVLSTVRALIRERVLEAALRWTPPSGFVAGMAKLASASLGTRPESSNQDSVMSLRAELLFIFWLSVLPLTDRFPIRKEVRDAAEAVASAAKLKPKLKRKLKPSEVVRLLRALPVPALRILAVLESRVVSTSIRAYLDSYSTVRITTTGADLLTAGLKPGPKFREILDKLLFARLDGKIRTVADEHAMLARLVERLGTRSELPWRNSVMSRARQRDD